jgi:gamma-glutamyltranspeptidase/glutathione hydrolase
MSTSRRTKAWLILLVAGSLFVQGYSQCSRFSNGLAATAHPLATGAALEILQQGGNAVDAAVAAAFAIGVVEPDGSGIGGGGGMVIYLNDRKESFYIDYYPKASERGSEAGFSGRKDILSGKSVCIPGTVAGLTLAHEKFGSLPLEAIMTPAIRLAEEGFIVDGVLAKILLDNIETLLSDPVTMAIFTVDGFPYMEGDRIVQKELAETLRTVTREGRDGFYKGMLAESMVRRLGERGGTQTLNDFASYNAILTEPLKGHYRAYDVLTAAPPQSGLTLIEALNILKQYPLGERPRFSESAEVLHILAETERLVYTDRSRYLGDPAAADVPVEDLTSEAYGRLQFERINPVKLDPDPYNAVEPGDLYRPPRDTEADGGHTTHLSVIDSDGNCVSLTQTLGLFFGSGQTVNGVVFNSAMTNFAYQDTDNPNIFADGKVPRSSIMPTILLKEGKPFLVIGSPGAARIISTMIEVVVNVVDYGMNAEEANLAPRFYCSNREKRLHLESGIGPGVTTKLEEMGHQLEIHEGIDLFFGGVQMIMVDPESGLYSGSADRRRGGSAEGY